MGPCDGSEVRQEEAQLPAEFKDVLGIHDSDRAEDFLFRTLGEPSLSGSYAPTLLRSGQLTGSDAVAGCSAWRTYLLSQIIPYWVAGPVSGVPAERPRSSLLCLPPGLPPVRTLGIKNVGVASNTDQ